MAVNQNIYPHSAQVRELPLYLVGIGGSEYQGHINRPEGYCWAQILFSAKGRGELKWGNTAVTLSRGYYFFLPAYCPHEYYPVDGCWDVRWVVFDGYACEKLLQELSLTKPLTISLNNSASLQNLFNKMYIAQKSDKIYGNYTCSGLIYQYILEFHRLTKTSSGGSDRSNLLMPVLNYIDDNYKNDFPMTKLAEIAGISPQHLCRLFKETMNMRPNEYVLTHRLNEAKRLLKHSDISIAEISRSVGFSDAGYFSTIFRRQEGISPMEYRRKNRVY